MIVYTVDTFPKKNYTSLESLQNNLNDWLELL